MKIKPGYYDEEHSRRSKRVLNALERTNAMAGDGEARAVALSAEERKMLRPKFGRGTIGAIISAVAIMLAIASHGLAIYPREISLFGRAIDSIVFFGVMMGVGLPLMVSFGFALARRHIGRHIAAGFAAAVFTTIVPVNIGVMMFWLLFANGILIFLGAILLSLVIAFAARIILSKDQRGEVIGGVNSQREGSAGGLL
ncbi:MAG: hypothetical protein FWB71_06670 [Defluviitaleaceae bacterium]|nr:hypothetical protein [Defluviitaleaceae bacterium]